MKLYFFEVNTINILSRVLKSIKFSLVFHTRENTDVFITLDKNISGIHFKRVNNLCMSSDCYTIYDRSVIKLQEHTNYMRNANSTYSN